MKHLLFAARFSVFALAVVMISIAPLHTSSAQEQAPADVKVSIDKNSGKQETQEDDGFSVSVSIGDDDQSADEKLDRLARKLKVVLGEEASEELRLELDGMSKQKKKEIIDKMSEGFVIDSDDMDDLSGLESLVALTAVILIFGMPVFILLLVLWFGSRKRRQKMELVRTYLDAGKDVPEQVLAEFSGAASNSLRGGVTPLSIGLGMICAAFLIGDATPLAALGLIPLFIGIARLIYWRFDEKPEPKADN